MVDIERKGITLNDWTKGISVDEFAGGSYYFSDGIQSGYNMKGFKLGKRVYNNKINNRANGYPVALIPNNEAGMLALTYDGRLEGAEFYNAEDKGALFAVPKDEIYQNYISGVGFSKCLYGEYVIGIRQTDIDLLQLDGIYDENTDIIDNPDFDNSGADWTIGTGWTIDGGAVHEVGQTGELEANLTETITNSDLVRVAIKIKNCTKGKVTVYFSSAEVGQTETGKNGKFTFSQYGGTGRTTVKIVPTSTFDGIVEIINVNKYDMTKVEVGKAHLSHGARSDRHPAVIRGGDLYIGCGDYVEIVSLTDRGVTSKHLIDNGYKIISITQQAGSLILWATNGYDSKQYYWNGVDRIASEIIEWKGLLIKGVVGTETLSYVLTTAGRTEGTVDTYEYRLYAVSGYQRSLIARKPFEYYMSDKDSKYYHKWKRFEFNDVKGDESMSMFLDSLYIPGCDGIYKYGSDIPGVRSTITRPIKYSVGATNILLGQRGNTFYFSQTVDGVNYISEILDHRYTSRGYIVTNSIYRDKLGTRKSLEKLKIGYKNLSSEDGGINIYAIVDDDYFWRFEVSGVTNRPAIGDIYTVAHQVKAEVINVDKTNKIITFRTTENKGGYDGEANNSLSKVSGDGDSSITVVGFDNMCLVKEIKSTEQGFGNDLIFGQNFVDAYMPYWYKMQLVIELYSIDTKQTPEIYEISIASDISDTVI